ncbi:MAG TPA: hypothetical protein G4O06_08600 [Dehalococcoidia bacterium]|nr:hypothetical protein [Dehalococcoidia bacterium]
MSLALQGSQVHWLQRSLLQGYQLCATTEGKSPSAINIVTYSVNYLEDFLAFREGSIDVTRVTRQEISAFVLDLKHKRCLSNHHFNRTQDRGLSGHTINYYLRSLRIVFSWLTSEGIIECNPFDQVKNSTTTEESYTCLI